MHIMFCYVVLRWIQMCILHETSVGRNQRGIVSIFYWAENHIRTDLVVVRVDFVRLILSYNVDNNGFYIFWGTKMVYIYFGLQCITAVYELQVMAIGLYK